MILITHYVSCDRMLVNHEFGPFVNKDSKILILGSIPSVKSREYGFYYMHKQNRFWKVISDIFDDKFPDSLSDKKEFLRKNKIALWDVLESCDIEGSSDSSIKNPKVNDIKSLILDTDIKYIKYQYHLFGLQFNTHIFVTLHCITTLTQFGNKLFITKCCD